MDSVASLLSITRLVWFARERFMPGSFHRPHDGAGPANGLSDIGRRRLGTFLAALPIADGRSPDRTGSKGCAKLHDTLHDGERGFPIRLHFNVKLSFANGSGGNWCLHFEGLGPFASFDPQLSAFEPEDSRDPLGLLPTGEDGEHGVLIDSDLDASRKFDETLTRSFGLDQVSFVQQKGSSSIQPFFDAVRAHNGEFTNRVRGQPHLDCCRLRKVGTPDVGDGDSEYPHNRNPAGPALHLLPPPVHMHVHRSLPFLTRSLISVSKLKLRPSVMALPVWPGNGTSGYREATTRMGFLPTSTFAMTLLVPESITCKSFEPVCPT